MSQESSNAQSRSITIDDAGVRRQLADGSREEITWSELSAVVIRVIPEGPWKEDVFIMLAGANGNGAAIPSSDPAADALIERLQGLPGFENEKFIEAMTTDADEAYMVWQAAESSETSGVSAS